MKNKDFFYLQYNKINWKNQEKTKINQFINNYIIENILLNHKNDEINLFDIGFGIGFFFEMAAEKLSKKYQNVILAGCEPSKLNYKYWEKKKKLNDVEFKTFPITFQNAAEDEKYDFITAIYTFPSFASDDLPIIAQKIRNMLKKEGKFILVISDEDYLKEKLQSEKDLFIETNEISYKGKKYKEILHYSDIPKIGKVIDYNREEKYYLDLFKDNGFKLDCKKDLNDNGFICTLLVFEKKNNNLFSKFKNLVQK